MVDKSRLIVSYSIKSPYIIDNKKREVSLILYLVCGSAYENGCVVDGMCAIYGSRLSIIIIQLIGSMYVHYYITVYNISSLILYNIVIVVLVVIIVMVRKNKSTNGSFTPEQQQQPQNTSMKFNLSVKRIISTLSYASKT